MSDPFIGEIIAVAFNYSNGFSNGNTFLPCNGQPVAISQYTALYSLIGATYGGNGSTTFNLPNLNAGSGDPSPRVAISQGQGPGLSNRLLGQQIGAVTETLSIPEMPSHNHGARLGEATAGQTPGPTTQSAAINPSFNGFVAPPANTQVAANAIGFDGGGQPHPNNQPTLGLWYCIAVTGLFPQFN